METKEMVKSLLKNYIKYAFLFLDLAAEMFVIGDRQLQTSNQ